MADVSDIVSAGDSTQGVEFFTPEYLERRRRALEAAADAANFHGIDELDPVSPSGHAYAIRKSTLLTSYTKRHQRKAAMDITPQDVIDALTAANVKNWVLMGLHGYVGYMPSPRATQDVDVLVPYSERDRAKRAIIARWPELIVRELSPVTRFLDPLDVDADGEPRPAIDVMHPWGPFQELILKEFVIIDEETKHRIPALEAALVSKYAAILSPHRDREKKDYDAGDFRQLVRANASRICLDDLHRLAGLVWEGGAKEIDHFIEIAQTDRPFPM